MTPEQLRALSTPDLVALYNKLTNKTIKRFATRAKGEAAVLKAIAAQPPVKVIRGSAGRHNGRPRVKFIVQLSATPGRSKLQKGSDRAALVEWLREKGPIQHGGAELPNAATIESIEAHFGKRMRGVAQKLVDKLWVRRIDLEAA